MTYACLGESVFLDPMPLPAMQSAQFQLHADIEDRHWWFVARRQILRRMIEAVVPAGRGNLVLDVGCGTGANLGVLAGQYRCVGVDTSADAIRLARSRFPQIEFREGFAPQAVEDVLEETDLVLMTDVLEHVRDDFELFSSLVASVRPGTYFLLTVPADLSLWSEHDESFGHYRRYDLQRFRQIWDGLPITALLTSPYNSRLFPVVKAIRWWNRRLGHARGAAGTDFTMPARPVNRILQRIMAGESRRLTRRLAGTASRTYSHGVSLMALLRRESGPCTSRTKPAELATDFFDPQALVAAT